MDSSFQDKIFEISSNSEFEEISLQIFKYQYNNNSVYKEFCDYLKKEPSKITSSKEIPFLPISFFKTHPVSCSNKNPEIIFTSSGTTGSTTSKHPVDDTRVYEKSFLKTFELFYGKPEEMVILGLLPSYLERKGSSLIYMVQELISRSQFKESGFYLHNLSGLALQLKKAEEEQKKVLLIGVSFALLDLVEKHQFRLKNTIVMETGGMKGRRKEMIREELHQKLRKGFGLKTIHSEYGMTELLSQAYSKGKGVFECPPWMRAYIRDPEEAPKLLPEMETGGINIIDLANFNSCSFIATQDLGKISSNGKLEILGRFDDSDIRGCNLLIL